jgi:branched-chain amino acid transport system ATP-binding protein
MQFLELENISKLFGGVQALNQVSFSIKEHEITAVIGPNGSGKTTLFNVITKIFPATSGSIIFRGKNITDLKSHEVARLNISRTFQNLCTFNDITVLENVMIGCHRVTKTGFFGSMLNSFSSSKENKLVKEMSMDCLHMVGLENVALDLAGNMPYGTRKLLDLARALVCDPDLLMLDEPATGLNDTERKKMSKLLCELQGKGKTCILVEHQMDFLMACSNYVVVLSNGSRIAEGSPNDIQNNRDVISAYLGEE